MTVDGDKFKRPARLIEQQDRYADDEVGITHPENSSFFRIRDNGDIEMVCSDQVAMIMNYNRGTITFMADHIKFLTSEDAGMRWNKLAFNPKATTYEEPAFIKLTESEVKADLYRGVDYYLPKKK